MTGQLDSDGKKLSTNSSSAGRYHTNWLNMMYPRLKLARNLLRDDGVIFISLDDNEVHNLRKICDEIFGEENFVAHCSVISNPRGRQSDTFVANVHDSLIIYSKSSFKAKIFGAPLSEEQKKEFNLTDEGGERYRLLGLRQRGAASNREDRPEMYFPIYVDPKSKEISLTSFDGWEEVLPQKSDGRDGRWMWGKEKCQNDSHRLVSKLIEHRNQHDIFVKDYLNRGDEERTRKFKSLWDSKNYNNQVGTQEVKALLDSDLMSFPKSRLLIEDICLMGSDSNDLILDFFAGSATTAHAVMSLNSAMSGKRKYILVQLPEPINGDKSSKSARFKTVADISKYRIKKASQRIREENPLFAGDLGFKVFKLDTSNIKPWDADIGNLTETILNEIIEKFAEGIDENLKKEIESKLNKPLTDEVLKEINTLISEHQTKSKQKPSLFESIDELQLKIITEALKKAVDYIKQDRSNEDVLYELLLKYGLDLTVPIETRTIGGKTAYIIGMGALIVCLDKDVSMETVEGIGKLKEELTPEIMRVVFKDNGFKDDNVKTNAIQTLKNFDIKDIKSL